MKTRAPLLTAIIMILALLRFSPVYAEDAPDYSLTDNWAYYAVGEDRAADLSLLEHRVLELVLDGYSDGEIDNLLSLVPGEAALLHNAVIEKMKQKANKG